MGEGTIPKPEREAGANTGFSCLAVRSDYLIFVRYAGLLLSTIP
ncbi:hypothetical protein DFQ59_102195 [Thioalbus denitrificans]|uniref:Uncharacterized protein n=1 Tax=Thioalbus denitrificans TaxID=547122 RepID=A0A369CF31_9GAMM|nr:hypothetical protein DFQ59_102195 [Thioalbus denitrificans]